MTLRHARGELALDRCLVVGIVNRTPDSFYDGGRIDLNDAIAHSMRLVEEGAGVLDLGAVKAGPGAEVPERDEIERLVPLVEAIVSRTEVPISVETGRATVARRAFEAGAAMVNDVTQLGDPDLAAECARAGAALVIMHHGGQIRGRPLSPRYEDVVADVVEVWRHTIAVAEAGGVTRDHIVVDPGLDFGKTTFHSLELVRRLPELVESGYPVLVAPSRKDIVGEVLDLPPEERLEGTLALVALSVYGGAKLIRVHDVVESVRVVRMTEAVMGVGSPRAAVRGLWD